MARPKTKEQLLSQSQGNFEQLFALIEPLSPPERIKPGVNGEWSIKDVLAHLTAWHQMYFIWYKEGMKGIKPEMPAPGYSWKTTPQLNEKMFHEHRDQSYETVVADLNSSHERIMEIIEGHSEEELFTKKMYKWTGSTSLGSYTISASSSHYQWAIDLIKKWVKTLPQV